MDALGDSDSHTETWVVTVNDGTEDVTQNITITINGTNDAPEVTAIIDQTNEDSNLLSFDLTDSAYASDPEGDSLSVTGTPTITAVDGSNNVVTLPDGTVSLTGNIVTIDPTVFNYLSSSGESVVITVTFDVFDGTTTTQNTLTTTIYGANDAPTSANNTVTTLEDNNYVCQASDFGFSDPDTGDALSRISVESLPTDGVLRFTNDGTTWQDVSAGGTFTKAMIDAGRLRFEPASNENGDAYASFTFKVNDGTANSADAYTITVDVDPDTHKVVDHSTMVEISNHFTNFASGSGGDGYETGKIHIVKESINVASGETMDDFAIGGTIVNDADNRLDSYLIFRNGQLPSSGSVYIDFETAIAGVYTASYHSDDDGALDEPFAKDGAFYPVRVGSDAIETSESVSVSGRRLTLNWDLGNSSDYDVIRVFVWSGKPAPVATDFDVYTFEDSEDQEWREMYLTIAGGSSANTNERIDWRDYVTSNNGAAVAITNTWLEGDTPVIDYTRVPANTGSILTPFFVSDGGDQLFRMYINSNNGQITLESSARNHYSNFEEQALTDANLTYRLNYTVTDEFGGSDDGVITVHVQPANDAP